MKLRTRLLLLAILPVTVSLFVFMIIEYNQIRKDGYKMLIAKNNAILSRMNAARSYIAQSGALDSYIAETKEKYPDGELPQEVKKKIMNFVPIAASWSIAQKQDKSENYQFKIASINPRNKKNQAEGIEKEMLYQLTQQQDTTITYEDLSTNTLWSVRPVYLSESEGCLTCHGTPSNSPWGDGTDILGYDMENWKDGELRGLFIIKSDLKPVHDQIKSTVLQTLIWILLFIVAAIMAGVLISKKIFDRLGGEPDEVAHIVHEVAEGKLNLTFSRENKVGIYKDIYTMHEKLNEIMSEIVSGADSLRTASSHISTSAQTMAQGSTEQAIFADKVTTEMNSMMEFANSAAEIANNTEQKTNLVKQGIERTAESANESMKAVDTITHKIEIITEIAYKTRILALNATIEAARAGDAGKSFAAIAEEIQRLAQLTRQSAEEIIEISTQTHTLSTTAQADLTDIFPKIKEAGDLVVQINNSTSIQKKGAEEINHAVLELSEITQHNASTSEELASSAEELSSQAEVFQTLVAYFQVDDNQEIQKPEEKVQHQTINEETPKEENKIPEPRTIRTPPHLNLDDDEFKSF